MFYIALVIIILIFIWRITAGFRKGMVHVATFCIVLILGAVGSYMNQEIAKVIQMIVVLFVVCLVYRLVNILFTSLELISELPVIKGLDKLLGAGLGFIEAGLIVGILVYFLKNWGLSILTNVL